MKISKCKNPVVIDFWTKEAEKAGGEAALGQYGSIYYFQTYNFHFQ